MTTQSKRTVAFALCGSFCSFAAVLPQLRVLTARGWDVLPVLSASAAGLDTRFGTASALRQTLYEVTGHRPLTTLQAVEPLGPQRHPRTMGFRAVPRRWASFCSGAATILCPSARTTATKSRAA